MLNDRRRRVLQALIEEYVTSASPVGSRTLVERHDLGCSPATVRNELSILEETGFVVQPHVSAGRIPTDTGYRSFVDDLLEHPDSTASVEKPAPSPRTNRVEIDEVMRDTTVALTQLTRCIAVTIAPSITVARLKRLDLLSMAPRRALFVLITETGQVVNRSIDLPLDVSPERLSEVERALNASVVGKRACEIRPIKNALDQGSAAASADEALLGCVVDEIIDALAEAARDRLHHAGVPALLAHPEFHDAERARPLIEFLEDGIAVLESLSEVLTTKDLIVRIGHENQRVELGNVSIVASAYSAGDASAAEGLVGVVGPTRMDYQHTIGAVRAASVRLTETLSDQ